MNDQPNTQEIKQCPFCEEGNIHTVTEEGKWSYGQCSKCGATGSRAIIVYDTEAEITERLASRRAAERLWNNRPIEDALRKEIEDIKALYKIAMDHLALRESHIESLECCYQDETNNRIKELEGAIESSENDVVKILGMLVDVVTINPFDGEELPQDTDELVKLTEKLYDKLTQARRPA